MHRVAGGKVLISRECADCSARCIWEIAVSEVVWLVHKSKTSVSHAVGQAAFFRERDERRQIVEGDRSPA
jgi:hypothetical protein